MTESEKDPEPDRPLMRGAPALSDEMLIELGRIVAASSWLEKHTQLFARELLHPRRGLALPLLSEMSYDRLLQVLPRLAALQLPPETCTLVQSFVDRAKILKDRRNRLHHSLIGVVPGDDSTAALVERTSFSNVDVSELRALADDMSEATVEIDNLFCAVDPMDFKMR